MSKIKIIIIILIILLIGIAGFLSYMGIFYTPVPSEKMTGPYTFVYEEFIGDYKKTGPVFDKVYKSLQDEGIKTTRALGIYFDNPAETPEDKLRSHCGIIIEENDLNKVPKLKSKYKVGHIGQHDSVVVEFPIKNSLSYMIGPMKCYPVIVKHAKEKGYKMTTAFELYDQPAERILYIMKIIK
ncbi:MAG: hypothetical protein SVR08_05860 [Spirochaetota bacterium]|nr:hypothetical protein [Spirochaetota bacterium]